MVLPPLLILSMENLQTSHLSNIPVDFDLPTGQRYVSYTFILVPPPFFFLKGCNQIWNLQPNLEFIREGPNEGGQRKKGGKNNISNSSKEWRIWQHYKIYNNKNKE